LLALITVLPAEARISDALSMAPSLPQFSKNNSSLGQMVNDFAVKVIVGEESPAEVDAFAVKYKAAGGDESYKEVNDWYGAAKK